jgi:iron complex transport system ATP-binding protein
VSRAAGSAPLIEVIDVSVMRGTTTAVDGASLAVHPGELVALVGPNGAGKSSLLALLAGDLGADRGDVLIAGTSISDYRPQDLARQRAVMPQANQVSFPFSVDDVIEMGRAPWRKTPQADEDDDAVREGMAIADVAHLRHRIFPTLSGGEQARVVLARTLAQRTPIVMLDEPTAALDLQHQMLVAEALRARADAGAAVVVVLHDLGLAGTFADRVVVMHQGGVVIDAPPVEALDEALLERVYGQRVEVRRTTDGVGWIVAPLREVSRRSTSAADEFLSRG